MKIIMTKLGLYNESIDIVRQYIGFYKINFDKCVIHNIVRCLNKYSEQLPYSNRLEKFCHNNWENKELNYNYIFSVNDVAISKGTINDFDKWFAYLEMKNEIMLVQNNSPRRRRAESIDENSCLRSLSINYLGNCKYLIAHYRSQNEDMKEKDMIYLADIARKLQINDIMVNVEEYQYNELNNYKEKENDNGFR